MAASKKSTSATSATTTPARKAPAKKTPAKKAPAKKTPAKTAPAKTAPAKTAPAKKAPAKTAPAKKTPAKKTPAKKAPAKTASAKKAPAKTAPAKKTPAKKTPAKTAPAKKTPTPTKKTRATNTVAEKKSPNRSTSRLAQSPASARRAARTKPNEVPSLLSNATFERVEIPPPRGHTKDGIAYTKDFDVKFLKAQRDELLARRASELARATRLEDEATSIIEDGEMGDVQFDDEGGEGDTMVVQRDLDRVLSTQARQTILEIDAALARIEVGTYGYSEVSGLPISRERLEALPETTVLAAEKVSGVGPR
jgi:RNA polymerase-binding transcription factor DksA